LPRLGLPFRRGYSYRLYRLVNSLREIAGLQFLGKYSATPERWQAVGFKFTLVLSREITDDESAILQEANRAIPIFGPDTFPTNADVPVTKMDFDDRISPSLEEAIETALESVKKVPELSVPGLTVPAQPAFREESDKPTVVAGEVLAEEKPEVAATEVVTPEVVAEEKPAKKRAARKPAAKRLSADEDLVEAAAGSA
jgi:hypothetical protein